MSKVLKVQGEPVLNFWDVKYGFSPLELYSQLESFISFAAVHCVPLPLQIVDLENQNRYIAEYVTKDFWYRILCRTEWPASGAIIDCFKNIVEDVIAEAAGLDDEEPNADRIKLISQAFDKELSDCKIYDKLRFIDKMCGNTDQIRKVICLLAISELSEMDVLKTEIHIWKNTFPDSNVGSGGINNLENKDFSTENDITFFQYEKEAILPVGNEPYRYWYYDSDAITPGAVIHTVRIEAKGNANQYAVLRIELYSEKDRSCVQSISLKKGEWRYCSVFQGKIIKFLPSISVSDDLCLMRKKYSEADITVMSNGAEDWSVDADDVSTFSAGSRNQGFLLIQNGRINSKFYKPAEDYFTRLQLDMITFPVIEVNINEKGYQLLLENGTVISDYDSTSIENAASLTSFGRTPFTKLSNGIKTSEIAVSNSKKSIAYIAENSDKDNVIFQADNNKVDILENDGSIVIHF